jgi:urease accessory protein
MFSAGKYAERDLPDYSGRSFEERGFTIGIGGSVLASTLSHIY